MGGREERLEVGAKKGALLGGVQIRWYWV